MVTLPQVITKPTSAEHLDVTRIDLFVHCHSSAFGLFMEGVHNFNLLSINTFTEPSLVYKNKNIL